MEKPGADRRHPGGRAAGGGAPGGAEPRHARRGMALPERRRLGNPLLAAQRHQCGQLRRPGSRLDVAGRQLRSEAELPLEGHPELHQREALLGCRLSAHRRVDGSGYGRDAVDLQRAGYAALSGIHAFELREGGRLRGDGRAAGDLRDLARVLPARVRRGDRRASRRLREAGSDPGVPEDGRRGSGRRPDRRSRPQLRPRRGTSSFHRLHHEFLTADCGERHHRHRELPRTGLPPDPDREHPRRHPRLRREDRRRSSRWISARTT